MAPGPSNTGAKSSGLCISTSRIFNSLSSMGVEKVLSDTLSSSTPCILEKNSVIQSHKKLFWVWLECTGTTNLVGKFTQSVRRIVQDVKDEGTASGLSKDEVIDTNERLRAVRIRLEESYDTAKKSLVTLMTKYGDSKSQRNVFHRYNMLKLMIKEVIRLETNYWTLVDIPKQEKQETVPSFVLRACSIMEKTQKSGEGVKTSTKLAEEAADRRERIERLGDMTTAQIEAENTQMTNDMYRLLKKYSGLRNLIRELKSEYMNSKVYPMFPRYTMLKDMIKDIMHHPDYMEVCHEVDA
ncbi:uncharacterized protein LOC113383011 [Ctenocephalides felis]|uniref:uncharacterized protein LOC113383011 n=1 Tax=Ctenocephalides felis TaxID=7515 RepID=UPI000E6E105E|nr:uncharacterized protein LOC113383011 [Ctenocephalides felis]